MDLFENFEKTKISMSWKSEKKCSKIFDFFSVSKYHPGLVEKRYGRRFYGKMKPSKHNLWKITYFDKKSHTLRGWEKILRFFFWKNIFFDQSSIHKLSKKFDFKRFYRGSSEKPASLEPRENIYPPRVTNRKNSDPPSRGDSYVFSNSLVAAANCIHQQVHLQK